MINISSGWAINYFLPWNLPAVCRRATGRVVDRNSLPVTPLWRSPCESDDLRREKHFKWFWDWTIINCYPVAPAHPSSQARVLNSNAVLVLLLQHSTAVLQYSAVHGEILCYHRGTKLSCYATTVWTYFKRHTHRGEILDFHSCNFPPPQCSFHLVAASALLWRLAAPSEVVDCPTK